MINVTYNPETHRLVPVELLEQVQDALCALDQEYREMNQTEFGLQGAASNMVYRKEYVTKAINFLNYILNTTSQPEPVVRGEVQELIDVLPEASPATKGQCNTERACGACFSGQGKCTTHVPGVGDI